MLVPKLRFKREDGTDYPEWEQYRLEDTVDFLDEKRKPITSKYRKAGQYPYYGASGIIDFIDDYIFDEELVLLSEDGANIVDRNYRVAFIATGKYWVNNHAHCLRPKQGFASYFISEALENIDYTVYNTGSAQPKLNQEVCRNLPLMYPCLEEQQKIANFLSTVDEVIAQSEVEVQNLEQQKKAAMQKIFSQEVRFKREDGTDYPEWEEKQLGSICDMIGDGLHKAPLYDENGDYYFINGNNLKNGKIVIEKETPKVSVGTLQKSDKSLDTATILMSINGTIGNLAFYQDEKIMLGKSVAYLKVGKNVCKKYIYSVLQTRKIIDSFKLSLTGTTIKNLGLTAIRDTFIFIPCLEEQRKIADFLSAYDDAISYAKQELDKWKELKKGLLQQMFV